jgi:hypothetical protein
MDKSVRVAAVALQLTALVCAGCGGKSSGADAGCPPFPDPDSACGREEDAAGTREADHWRVPTDSFGGDAGCPTNQGRCEDADATDPPLNPVAASFLECEWNYWSGSTCCVFDKGLWVLKDGPCPYQDPGCNCPAGFAPMTPLEPGCVGNVCASAYAGLCSPTVVAEVDPESWGDGCPGHAPFYCLGDGSTYPKGFCSDCPCAMLDTGSTYDCECGDLGDECVVPEDCDSQICFPAEQSWTGNACIRQCGEECPMGYDCRYLEVPGQYDPFFVCMPHNIGLCRPCQADDECAYSAEPDARCISFGNDGSFCATGCYNQSACPDGYQCKGVANSSGETTKQCVPESGSCGCSPRAIATGASTVCHVTNLFGSCPGTRFCTVKGLTDCSARTPVPEIEDGKDNDCDGKTDETDHAPQSA